MNAEQWWTIQIVLASNAVTICLFAWIFNLSLSITFLGLSFMSASWFVWSLGKEMLSKKAESVVITQ